ncbi:MAG: hypothetical protein WAM82_19005 [Thermoanaerobaculia bacterium]
MRPPAILGALLLVGSQVVAGADSEKKVVAVERFGGAPSWTGPQKIQADGAGHVFLLRADTLEIYPLGKGGRLGEPTKLEAASPINEPVLDAAMGPGGPGDWLLRLPQEVHWFVEGKEKPLPPLSWRPWGVGYIRSTPVVSVLPLPAPVNGIVVRRQGQEGPAAAPVVMALDGDRWSPLVEVAWPEQRDTGSLTESCARLLLGDRAGKLWAARTYGYVLERYSAAGRPLSKVLVDKGKVEHKLAKEAAVPSEVREADRGRFRPFLGMFKISDLTEGLDHRIYLLVQAGKGDKGMYLDRYDPAQSLLERVTLGVQAEGMATLAAGRDGLYLVGHGGDQGRWRVSWELLDQAEWKPVLAEDDSAPPRPKAVPAAKQPPAAKVAPPKPR